VVNEGTDSLRDAAIKAAFERWADRGVNVRTVQDELILATAGAFAAGAEVALGNENLGAALLGTPGEVLACVYTGLKDTPAALATPDVLRGYLGEPGAVPKTRDTVLATHVAAREVLFSMPVSIHKETGLSLASFTLVSVAGLGALARNWTITRYRIIRL